MIRERIAIEGLENVRVLTTGAEQLEEIPSDSVDLAFSAFSMHHFKDKRAGLAEIRRILRSGGRFYVWDRVPGMIMRHGTRPEELDRLSGGFTSFELLSTGRTVRARFTK
jgi:SAM-dependent methyltransferase